MSIRIIFCLFLSLFTFLNLNFAQITPDSSSMQRDSLPVDSLDEDINRPLGDTTPIWVRVSEQDNWQRLDTSLLHFEQLNPTWDKQLPDFCLNLGAWGTPLVHRTYNITPRGGFWLGLEAYKPYQLQPNQLKWYKIGKNRPFTELFYSQVNQRNTFVKASFAHQATPRVYYMVHFNVNNALGFYNRQKARHQNLAIALRLLSKNMRYEARPLYQNYNAEIIENGGISDSTAVVAAASVDLLTLGVNLNDAEHLIETNSFSFTHYWHHKAVDSSLSANGKYRLQQNFGFSSEKDKYFDSNPSDASSFYADFRTNARGIRHFIGLQTWQHSIGALLPLGASLQNSPFVLDINLVQKFFILNREVKQVFVPNFFANGKIYNNPQATKTPYTINAEAQLAQNNRFLDVYTRAEAAYQLNNWFKIELKGLFQRYQPSQIAQQLYVSRQLVWQNDTFNSQNELVGEAIVSIPKLKLAISAKNIRIGQLIYADSNRVMRQDAAANNILQLGISHLLKFKNIYWENKAIFQQISSPNNTLRLPTWNAYSQLCWQFRPYPTLLLRTGATVRWWSAYKANAYFPLTQQFNTQNYYLVAPYPVVDYFINAKIWQARVFVNAENILQLFQQTTYFTAPNYAQPNFLVRFGVYWSLFD